MRIVVDLPAPFGPRKPVTTPGRTVNVRWSTAVLSPYRFVSPCNSIMVARLASMTEPPPEEGRGFRRIACEGTTCRRGRASAGLLGGDAAGQRLLVGRGTGRGDRGTGQRGQHLAHVGQLRVDAVAAVGERRQLALGLAADPVGLGVRVRDDVLGLALRGLHRLAGAALGVGAQLLDRKSVV